MGLEQDLIRVLLWLKSFFIRMIYIQKATLCKKSTEQTTKLQEWKKKIGKMHANQNLRVSLRPSKLSHLQESWCNLTIRQNYQSSQRQVAKLHVFSSHNYLKNHNQKKFWLISLNSHNQLTR